MFKGLIYLFSSGKIFSPPVFFGGLAGIICYIKLDAEEIMALFLDYRLYLSFFLFVSLYVYFFKKTLADDLIHIDWKAMLAGVFKSFLLMTFSFGIGFLLASYLDFSDLTPKPQNDEVYSQYPEILQMKKQAEELIKNYN